MPLDIKKTEHSLKILKILESATKNMTPPMSHLLKIDFGSDPFFVLIGCLLSLRARDSVTYGLCKILFNRAKTASAILSIPLHELEDIIRPIGFFRRKARILHEVCEYLLKNYDGKVPFYEQELLAIPHVGRKTANLVLAEAFNVPAICVDIHVHRISNRLGLVKTKTPEQTELALQKIVPQEWWTRINEYLVMWGQNICTPISPKCSQCPLLPLCPRIGVMTSR